MNVRYEDDIVAWASEQSRLIRAGRFELLDLEHIAEEIEDVGKSEQRELANRMAVLLAHLLKWQYQPERRGASWQTTIKVQRKAIARALEDTPSLKGRLTDTRWWQAAWDDGLDAAMKETNLALNTFPETCPWTNEEILGDGMPESN